MKTDKNRSQQTYAEKLKDPRWQKKRLEILNRDLFKCRRCSCESKSLHVHHSYYVKGANPWDYPDESLISLCEDCHTETESGNEKIRRITGDGSWRQIVTLNFLDALEESHPFSGTAYSNAVKKFNLVTCNIGRARKSMDERDKKSKDAHLQKAKSAALEMFRMVYQAINQIENESIDSIEERGK